MPEEKKRIVGLPSTIVFGIFLSIALILVMILLPLDFKKMVADIASNSSSSETSSVGEAGGRAIAVGVAAGLAGALLIVLMFFLIVASGIPTIISLPFTIRNIKKAEAKAIRIINIAYVVLAGFILAIDVIKLIQLFL